MFHQFFKTIKESNKLNLNGNLQNKSQQATPRSVNTSKNARVQKKGNQKDKENIEYQDQQLHQNKDFKLFYNVNNNQNAFKYKGNEKTQNQSSSQKKFQQMKSTTSQNSVRNKSPIIQNKKIENHNLTDMDDSIMGSIQEFQNTEVGQIELPKSQLKEFQNKVEEKTKHFYFDKSTGKTFDLRNAKDVIKYSQLLKTQENQTNQIALNKENQNKQPWEDWWKQKKQISIDLVKNAQSNNLEACKKLLDDLRGDLKANINYKIYETGYSALHYASLNNNLEMMKYFIENDGNVNCQNNSLETPLMISCDRGKLEMVYFLLNKGANINMQDVQGNTALHYACKRESKEITQLLIQNNEVKLNLRNQSKKLGFEMINDKTKQSQFEEMFRRKKIPSSSKEKIQKQIEEISSTPKKIKNIMKGINQYEINRENSQILKSRSQSRNATQENSFSQIHNQKKKISEKENENKTKIIREKLEKTLTQKNQISLKDIKVHCLLGKGSFGQVYLIQISGKQEFYAMKVLDKGKLEKFNVTKYAITERNILASTQHPFIIKLNFSFQTENKLFLILDYAPGGDLGKILQKKIKFEENDVKIYAAQIITAIEDLHKRDIIFRDLKPDNIVIDQQGNAIITDFGLSKEGVIEQHQGAKSFCGSVAYLAPEMITRQGHGKALDWYLLGVVIYELLVGIPPFYAPSREQLFQNIEKGPLELPKELSKEAKNLLKGLLNRNPQERLGCGKEDCEDLKQHSFFKGINWKDILEKKVKPPQPEILQFRLNQFENNSFLEYPELDYYCSKNISNWSYISQVHSCI